jgi:hypothetical protein
LKTPDKWKVLGYLRLRSAPGRILALFGGTALSTLLMTFVTATYWDGVVVPYRADPVNGTQTLWGGLLFGADMPNALKCVENGTNFIMIQNNSMCNKDLWESP